MMNFQRFLPLLGLLALGIISGGCRLCADCDLNSYPTYGGVWERTNRDHGRVGSLFDPGGSRAADLQAKGDSEDADRGLRVEYGDQGDEAAEEKGDTDGSFENPDEELSEDELERRMRRRLERLDLEDIDARSPDAAEPDPGAFQGT